MKENKLRVHYIHTPEEGLVLFNYFGFKKKLLSISIYLCTGAILKIFSLLNPKYSVIMCIALSFIYELFVSGEE